MTINQVTWRTWFGVLQVGEISKRPRFNFPTRFVFGTNENITEKCARRHLFSI